MLDLRRPRDFVQHLRARGLHARALAGGKDDNVNVRHDVTIIVSMRLEKERRANRGAAPTAGESGGEAGGAVSGGAGPVMAGADRAAGRRRGLSDLAGVLAADPTLLPQPALLASAGRFMIGTRVYAVAARTPAWELPAEVLQLVLPAGRGGAGQLRDPYRITAVSYTHLTMPTSDLVEISVVAVTLKKKKNN